jgi:glycosyltransferase involved in cell wall biosynthesis
LPAQTSVVVLYNPVVPDQALRPLPPPHAWLMQKEIPTIMGIGRLKEEKNFSLLIRAFAHIAALRQIRLIIIGEGEQRSLLEELARELGVEDKIAMPGFIADPLSWLAYATLLVCPSKKEGFGNVIVEALACGVPVVACDCPFGPAEILERGLYGRLVPVDDYAAMVRAINETLDQNTNKEVLKARAALFTVSRCIDGYGALIDNSSSLQSS